MALTTAFDWAEMTLDSSLGGQRRVGKGGSCHALTICTKSCTPAYIHRALCE